MTVTYHADVAVDGQTMDASDVTLPDGQLDLAIVNEVTARTNADATLTTNSTTNATNITTNTTNLTALTGGATVTVARLREWTEAEAYQLTSVFRDSDDVPTTATVIWPDGSGGTFTTTNKNVTYLAVDAYTITHTLSAKVVTQSLITRNANGRLITKPAVTIV